MWLVKAWPADKGLSVQLTLTLRLAFYVIFYDVLLKLFSSTASPFDFGIMCFPTAPKRPIRYSLGFISFQSTTCILVTNACGWLYYDEFNKCTLILHVYIYIYIYSMDWNGLSRGKPTGNQSLSLVFILAKMQEPTTCLFLGTWANYNCPNRKDPSNILLVVSTPLNWMSHVP